jgi:hypothetical protein
VGGGLHLPLRGELGGQRLVAVAPNLEQRRVLTEEVLCGCADLVVQRMRTLLSEGVGIGSELLHG